MSNSVVLLKLLTSEEIISKVKSEDSEHYVLDRPRTLAPMQTENGTVTLALIPWLMGAQDPNTKFEAEVVLQKSSVVGLVTEPPKSLTDMYLSKTSGIDLFTG